MSESYNALWRLELENSSVGGVAGTLSHFAHANAVPASDHIDLNDFENGWYIDPAKLCKDNSAGSNIKIQNSKWLRGWPLLYSSGVPRF